MHRFTFSIPMSIWTRIVDAVYDSDRHRSMAGWLTEAAREKLEKERKRRGSK